MPIAVLGVTIENEKYPTVRKKLVKILTLYDSGMEVYIN